MAVASVSTARTAGSAVLLAPGVLVTSAHVVWPDAEVEVRFEGGPAARVPVSRVDWVADLALLDTAGLDGLPEPLRLADGLPQPGTALTLLGRTGPDGAGIRVESGTVTGIREWEAGGLTFLETDLPIGDGQSGGVVLSGDGAVLGVTGLSDGGLAVALSAPDLRRRLAGDPGDGPGDRRLEALAGPAGAPAVIRHLLDEAVYLLDPPGPAGVDLPGAPFEVSLVSADGLEEAHGTGPGAGSVDPSGPGPHFLVISPLGPGGGTVTPATGSSPLRPIADPDHGRALVVGGSLVANTDYPGDLDWFTVELERGARVELTATSTNMDPALLAGPLGDLRPATVSADRDSGGGPLGWDARLVYIAERSGVHVIAVFDESRFGPGAYLVTVAPAA